MYNLIILISLEFVNGKSILFYCISLQITITAILHRMARINPVIRI